MNDKCDIRSFLFLHFCLLLEIEARDLQHVKHALYHWTTVAQPHIFQPMWEIQSKGFCCIMQLMSTSAFRIIYTEKLKQKV